MAGLVYYLAGKTPPVTRKDIVEAGIGYAYADGEPVTPCGVRTGPGKKAGVVVGNPNRTPVNMIGYYPKDQEWMKIPGREVWVAARKGNYPMPEELLRGEDERLPGHEVRLADGNDWVVPLAREYAEGKERIGWHRALPHVLSLDEEGHWVVGGVEKRFQQLWDVAERWMDTVRTAKVEGAGVKGEKGEKGTKAEGDGEKVTFSFQDVNTVAVQVLQTNYRIGNTEAALLGLFTTESAVKVLNALVDGPGLELLLKKKHTSEESDG